MASFADLHHALVRLDDEAFAALDANGDGTVSAAELRAAFKATKGERKRGKVSDAMLDAIIALGDTDGDGLLSFAEFTELAALDRELDAIRLEKGVVGAAPTVRARLGHLSALSISHRKGEVNQLCMALLHGRAGRVTSEMAVSDPGSRRASRCAPLSGGQLSLTPTCLMPTRRRSWRRQAQLTSW
jgi:hypothetical protein